MARANMRWVVGLAIAGAGALAAGPSRADAVRDAVEAANRTFVAAFVRGDADAVAQLYTEDAQVIAPGEPVARGRSEIAAAWRRTIEAGVEELNLQTLDVESAGDLACETGIVRLVSKDGTPSEARYVVVWKRRDGHWRLHRDIWNAEK